MFLVFVLTGNQIQLERQDKSLRMPPTIQNCGDELLRYDSVMNKNGDHTIIYGNSRQYPCFMITFGN